MALLLFSRFLGPQSTAYRLDCHAGGSGLSSLIRNVPGLTSIEVSPFWPSETARVFLPCCRRLPGRWKGGNPAFGFPLFHRPPSLDSCFCVSFRSAIAAAGAVGMWVRFADPRSRGKRGNPVFGFPRFPPLRHFHSSVLCFLGAPHVYLLVASPPGMAARRRRRPMSSRRLVFQLGVGRSCGDLFEA